MAEQMKNMMIGLFVIAAFSIIVFMLLFLHPSMGDEGQRLRVRFADIDKVNVGTRVTFAGKPVGEVIKIREVEETQLERREWKGDIYVYELELAVDTDVKIYNSDKISLRTSGLLGEKSISIDPEPIPAGQELRLINDEIIYAEQVGSVEDTFYEFKEVADRFDLALNKINNALDELAENNFWDNLAKTAENINDITGSLNEPEQLSTILANVYDMSERLSENWDNVDSSINNLAETMENTKEISAMVRDGQGTAGKILVSDDLYLRLGSMLSKAEVTLDDVNHYGVLFHLDKGWQRMRARRLNLLQKLCSPQEFRNYFNDEISQIQTSLSRVSMVLEKAGAVPGCYDFLANPEYKKVYGELQRRIETLEEAIRMYNIQAMETEVRKTELQARQ